MGHTLLTFGAGMLGSVVGGVVMATLGYAFGYTMSAISNDEDDVSEGGDWGIVTPEVSGRFLAIGGFAAGLPLGAAAGVLLARRALHKTRGSELFALVGALAGLVPWYLVATAEDSTGLLWGIVFPIAGASLGYELGGPVN